MSGAVDAVRGFADEHGITLANDAQATLPSPLLQLHRAILTAFVDSGAAPITAWIGEQAIRLGIDRNRAITHLDKVDLVHTADGEVTVAYPFSGAPTPHRVRLADGPAVWAMCAGDALGIPLMTGRAATITSMDAQTGEPIRVGWHDGAWTWDPADTVMLVAATTGRCARVAEAACRYVHFFANRGSADAYLRADSSLCGVVLDQAAAVEQARLVFGSLLGRYRRAGTPGRARLRRCDRVPVHTDGPMNRREGGSVATVAGAGAAVVACCAVQLLVLAGVLAGVSGLALGGLKVGVGVTMGAAVWVAVMLRRRARRSRPAGVGEGRNDDLSVRCRNARGTGAGTC